MCKLNKIFFMIALAIVSAGCGNKGFTATDLATAQADLTATVAAAVPTIDPAQMLLAMNALSGRLDDLKKSLECEGENQHPFCEAIRDLQNQLEDLREKDYVTRDELVDLVKQFGVANPQLIASVTAAGEWEIIVDLGVGPVPNVGNRSRFVLKHRTTGQLRHAYCVHPGVPAPPVGSTCAVVAGLLLCGDGSKQWLQFYEPTGTVTPGPTLTTGGPTTQPTATQTPVPGVASNTPPPGATTQVPPTGQPTTAVPPSATPTTVISLPSDTPTAVPSNTLVPTATPTVVPAPPNCVGCQPVPPCNAWCQFVHWCWCLVNDCPPPPCPNWPDCNNPDPEPSATPTATRTPMCYDWGCETATPTRTATPVSTVCPGPSATCYDKELHQGDEFTVPGTVAQPWGVKGDHEMKVIGAPNVVFYDEGINSDQSGTLVIFESSEEIIAPCNGANAICLTYRGCGDEDAGFQDLIDEMFNVSGNCESGPCRWLHIFRVRDTRIIDEYWINASGGRIARPSGVYWPATGAALCNGTTATSTPWTPSTVVVPATSVPYPTSTPYPGYPGPGATATSYFPPATQVASGPPITIDPGETKNVPAGYSGTGDMVLDFVRQYDVNEDPDNDPRVYVYNGARIPSHETGLGVKLTQQTGVYCEFGCSFNTENWWNKFGDLLAPGACGDPRGCLWIRQTSWPLGSDPSVAPEWVTRNDATPVP